MKKLVLALFVLMGIAAQAQVTTISGDITSNTTWTADHVYELTGGFVYVTNNATLTIQPGTLIKGNQSALVITRGAKIMASGTASQPIVFTSYQAVGQRAPGDWGGVLVLGKAPINDPAGQRLAEGGIDPVKGLYGGTDADDNSGVLEYVRIEYAGIAFQPNNETNGLTMGGVGRGTTVNHIQVSFGGDDSFEFFGGTVNAKHLISYRGVDDEFDTDYGFQGMLQFCVSLRDSSYADVSGSNGFESDNDATGSTNTPNTKPIISNFTIVGPMRTLGTTVHANYKRAAHLRRSTSECVYNSLLMGYPTGLKIEGQTTADNATNGSLQWKNNIIAGCTNSFDSTGLTGINVLSWFNSNSNSTLTNVGDLMLGNPYNWTAPNFQPQVGSPALLGADFGAANLSSSFFTVTTYRGAFDGVTDWTSGWSNWDPQNSPYTSGITAVTAPVAGTLSLYPNPASDEARISFTLDRGGDVNVSVLTLNGQQVMSETRKMSSGVNQINLTTSKLPAGLYLVRVVSNAGSTTARLTVAH
ncbi:MAG: T9SS type A sorting domain-containing protein [Bacteroidia bacterium]